MTVISNIPLSFAEKIIDKEGGLIRYITATKDGKPCWYFLKLHPAQYREYLKNLKLEQLNLNDFGEILLCGWGEHASSIAKKLMRKKYDVVC